MLVLTRKREFPEEFGSNRLTHVLRALLRKVGERSDSIVINGDNKQLSRRWEVGAMIRVALGQDLNLNYYRTKKTRFFSSY